MSCSAGNLSTSNACCKYHYYFLVHSISVSIQHRSCKYNFLGSRLRSFTKYNQFTPTRIHTHTHKRANPLVELEHKHRPHPHANLEHTQTHTRKLIHQSNQPTCCRLRFHLAECRSSAAFAAARPPVFVFTVLVRNINQPINMADLDDFFAKKDRKRSKTAASGKKFASTAEELNKQLEETKKNEPKQVTLSQLSARKDAADAAAANANSTPAEGSEQVGVFGVRVLVGTATWDDAKMRGCLGASCV